MDLETAFVGFLFLLLVFVGVVLVLGDRKKAELKRNYPPPGQLFDIGGYRLHLYCQGQGDPVVVMDAGLGEPGLTWSSIQAELARTTRVCVYDRAGHGWSDPSPKPRTNEVMVDELHALLDAAGVPRPYVLVGASLGGLNMRLYAHRYPREVAGLVLVDAAHEEQYSSDGMRTAFEKIVSMMPRMYGLLQLLVRTGIPALNPARFSMLAPAGPGLSREAAEAYRAMRTSDPKHLEASSTELAAVFESHARLRQMQITSLGDLPLVVLMHGKVEQMMTPEMTELNERTNRKLQTQLAAQSVNGKLVVAEESGHAIQFEQPELVIAAILEVLSMARERLAHGGPAANGRGSREELLRNLN